MPITDQEVIQVLDELLSNLGLQLEEYDIVFLTQAEIYVEIFKVMFPSLASMLDIDFDNDEVDDQELIQTLIDFLSKNIIRMDLDHISGEKIISGDKKNMLNFLQLLTEISKMINGEEEAAATEENEKLTTEERLNQSSPESLQQISSNNSKGSSGVPAELVSHSISPTDADAEAERSSIPFERDSCVEEINTLLEQNAGRKEPRKEVQKEKYIQDQRRSQSKNQSAQKSYSEGRISEVSRSREISDYERTSKKVSATDQYLEETRDAQERQRTSEDHEEDYDQNPEADNEEHELITEEAEEYEQEDEDDLHQNQQMHDAEMNYAYDQNAPKNYYANLKNQIQQPHVTEDAAPQVSREGDHSDDIAYYSSDPVDYQNMNRSAEGHTQNEESHGRYIHTVGEDEKGEEDEEEDVYDDEEEPIETQKKTMEMTYNHHQHENNTTEPNRANHVKSEKPSSAHHKQESRETLRGSNKKSLQNAKSYAGGKVPYRPLKNTVSSISNRSYDETQKRFTQESDLKQNVSYEGATLRAKHKKKAIVYAQPNPTEEVGSGLNSTEDIVMKPRGDSYIQDKATTKKMKHRRPKKDFQKTEYQRELEKYAQERLMKQMEVTRKRRISKKPSTQKIIIRKGPTLKQVFDDNQEGLYNLLRGEKLSYVKKINKVKYQLENKKVEDEQNMYITLKREQDLDEMNRLLAVKRGYQEKLSHLHRAHISQKGEHRQNAIAQKAFLRTLKKELILDNLQELNKLQNRWIYEKTRFEILTQDTEYLERRVLDLYRKS